ncbi:unnamed protein product [Candidula unifasciata]|uniref:Uncharacterized protein n=1 Tax=Candidula unifasciata TaxID=100452 RepID=A0A8S3ZDQ7_9EUPU|nr:unnamed protein product [Candidula unifasciata]
MKSVLGVLLFIVTFVAVFCDVANRNVTLTPMPDCDKYKLECDIAKDKGFVVVFATAYAKGDSLLYAFSSIGMPTIALVRVTGDNASMHFNWTKLINESSLEEAITIEDHTKVAYRMGLAFPRLLEYNDEDDQADLKHMNSKPNNASYWKIRDFSDFNWSLDYGSQTKNAFILTATSEQGSLIDTNSTGNWSISFKFTVQGGSGRDPELPSLKFGANQTQFDFVISNFTPTYASSRFAVETVLVSQSSSEMNVDTSKSIDDEYSPGVFQMINWLSNPSEQQSTGFVQWKPVCYTTSDRSRSTATKVKDYELLDLTEQENITRYLNSSIVLSIFGADLYNEKVVTSRATNISFGLSQDRFYDNTNYTVWSAAIGFGTPPQDAISMTVIVTIGAGLGLPVIILILGGVYTCVKKRRSKQTEYEPITGTVDRTELVIN